MPRWDAQLVLPVPVELVQEQVGQNMKQGGVLVIG